MIKKISGNFFRVCLLFFAFVYMNTDAFSKNNFDYVYTIKSTNFDFKPQKNHFLDSLAREYKSYAIYKSEMTNDFDGANFFAKKSLKAYTGEFVKPYDVYKLNMKLSAAAHIYRVYDDLMFLFTNNFTEKYPVLMADAQSKFDCFIDNEVLHSNVKQAKTCYQKFTKTMAILNKKLDEVCDAKCKLLRQETNIGKKLKEESKIKTTAQVVRKKLKLKNTTHNPHLNRYVQVYPLNEMDKLKEEKLLIKNEAFVRPIGKKVVNNDFVIPVKKEISTGFANTMAGADLQNKNAVSVKPVSDADNNKNTQETKATETKQDAVIMPNNVGSGNDLALADIQKKLQEIDLKIELLSKKNCNCNLDGIKADLSSLTNKTNVMQNQNNKDGVVILEKETQELENKIENIAAENGIVADASGSGAVVSIEAEVKEEVDVIDADEAVENEAEQEPEFQEITETETVETEIFDKPSNALPYELYFDWDKDNVKPEYRTELQDITEKALKSKETIVIQGHTDNTGDEKYNDDLSKRRATNVGKVVMSYGVPKEKIILQGVGSREPKVPTKKGERNEKNRRVVIK